jgi:two-component system, NarL family, nitrate/nitrite response regulator NarL
MRVLLIDDHALVRKGLEELLASRGVEVVASVGTGEEGVHAALAQMPDIVLLDVKMRIMSGIETLRRLRECGIEAPVVMLTMSQDDADLHSALREGAQGYLLKDMDPDELVPALESALRGENVVAREMVASLTRLVQGGQATVGTTPAASAEATAVPGLTDLTPREQEILAHLADGQSNKGIARSLSITDGTVKLHVKSILRKLGVHSRVEAAVIAVEHGLARRRGAVPPANSKEEIS